MALRGGEGEAVHVGIAEAKHQRGEAQVGEGEIVVVLRLHGCAFGIDHVEEGTAGGILQVGLYAEMAGQVHEEDEMEIVEGFGGGVKPLQAAE